MNYLLFNNEILLSDGTKLTRIQKGPHLSHALDPVNEAHLCVVDVDVLIASASENALDKKDGILAKKFSATYEGEYVLQDEKIGNNLFQVIGIRSDKVKEVYSLIPSEKIKTFVPYAVALRRLLELRHTEMSKPIVFVDDLGAQEKLITVFEGLKFSRTRTIFANQAQQILPEIKRSAINFEKKLGDQKDQSIEGFTVVTNNATLGAQIREIENALSVEVLDDEFPALEGLMAGGFNLKYVLPEEIIKKRKGQERKKQTRSFLAGGLVLAAAMFFYIYGQVHLGFLKASLLREEASHFLLIHELNDLDPFVYRQALKKQKAANYALVFLKVSDSIPDTYETYSFRLSFAPQHWILEEYLYTPIDGLYENIEPRGVLKGAFIKDFWVNNRPGKFLRMEI